jgi:hypothetical protein
VNNTTALTKQLGTLTTKFGSVVSVIRSGPRPVGRGMLQTCKVEVFCRGETDVNLPTTYVTARSKNEFSYRLLTEFPSALKFQDDSSPQAFQTRSNIGFRILPIGIEKSSTMTSGRMGN